MFKSLAAGIALFASACAAYAGGARIVASSQKSDVYSDPVVAIPLTGTLLANESAVACFSELLALGGYGQRAEERAAFLILSDDGSHNFTCALWPPQHTFQREEWSGRIPKGTVAIVHTHPTGHPDPSSFDASEARRLGVPIVAITPGAVEVVAPRDGRIIVLLGERGWWKQRETRVAQGPRPGE